MHDHIYVLKNSKANASVKWYSCHSSSNIVNLKGFLFKLTHKLWVNVTEWNWYFILQIINLQVVYFQKNTNFLEIHDRFSFLLWSQHFSKETQRRKEIKASHLLRESLQWPVSISPRRPRTGRVWRGGSLHSWVVPGEEGEPQRGHPGNSCQLSGWSPSRWPALSLEGWGSGAFPFRLRFLLCRLQPAGPICLSVLLRLLGVYPVSSPWLRGLCSVLQAAAPLPSAHPQSPAGMGIFCRPRPLCDVIRDATEVGGVTSNTG